MRRLIWPVLFLFLMLLQGSMSVYYTGWLSCDLLLLAVYAYAVRNTLERTPPELSADIMDRGIVMTGGSSMLRNLDRLISQETGMPVFVSDEALNCVALGTGIAVENIDIYRKGFMTSK